MEELPAAAVRWDAPGGHPWAEGAGGDPRRRVVPPANQPLRSESPPAACRPGKRKRNGRWTSPSAFPRAPLNDETPLWTGLLGSTATGMFAGATFSDTRGYQVLIAGRSGDGTWTGDTDSAGVYFWPPSSNSSGQ